MWVYSCDNDYTRSCVGEFASAMNVSFCWTKTWNVILFTSSRIFNAHLKVECKIFQELWTPHYTFVLVGLAVLWRIIQAVTVHSVRHLDVRVFLQIQAQVCIYFGTETHSHSQNVARHWLQLLWTNLRTRVHRSTHTRMSRWGLMTERCAHDARSWSYQPPTVCTTVYVSFEYKFICVLVQE